jgi:hypothetical protein
MGSGNEQFHAARASPVGIVTLNLSENEHLMSAAIRKIPELGAHAPADEGRGDCTIGTGNAADGRFRIGPYHEVYE